MVGVVKASSVASWRDQGEVVRSAIGRLMPDSIGIYVHGSAALGDFGPASDLDVLVVVDDGPEREWDAIGKALLAAVTDEPPVELSVVGLAAAAAPAPPWPFLLHVNSGQQRWVAGGDGGDPDLVAHYAVVRAAAVVLHGADAHTVVGPVGREELLAYLSGELAWGCAEADQRYAILNACRAVAYADEDLLLSKVAGGQWWLEHHGPDEVVTAALAAQHAGVDLGLCGPAARALVATAIAEVDRARR